MGASTPRYMRARATSATSPVATHLPIWRQRPSGTRPYKIPTRTTTSAAICSDGSAQAVQSVRNSTPNGRGRCTSGASRYWIISPCTIQASSTTSSCRRRRRISRASSSPHSSTLIAVQEPSAASRPHRPASRPGHLQPGQPPDHRVVDHRDRHRRPPQPIGEDQQRQRHQHHGSDQPAHPGGLQVMRQRWRLPGGTPSARRAPNPSRAELHPPIGGLGWRVRRHVHDASQPGRRTAAQRRCTLHAARQVATHAVPRHGRPRRDVAHSQVDPAFQRTAASTDRSAWHPPEPIARPQSATSSDAQAEQVRFRMGAPTRRGCD